MKTEIYEKLKSITTEPIESFLTKAHVRPVDLEKDFEVVTFDGEVFYKLSDLEALYVDICYEEYLDWLIG